VVTPGADPLEPQVIKMKKKIAAGAQFFQTQAIYDTDKFQEFANQVQGFNVPIIAGIVVLKSAGMAKFMNENVAGITVPDSLIEEMMATKKEDQKKKAVEVSARTIRGVKPFCQGVHIMPLGWDELVPEIVEAAELG
jgi:5,10-methylenetetrahydrofolate reductase